MKWGQIKTLFILCFLLLNVYLLVLVLEKQGSEELELIASDKQKSGQEQLEIENITITDDIPESKSEEVFITIKQKTFTAEEVEQLKSMENQEVEVVNNSFIISQLEETIAIPENATDDAIVQLVSNTVYLGSEYIFEHWDKERNILVFFQKKNTRPVYYNPNGMILVYLNESNEILGYTQSYLGDPESMNDERPVIKPLAAILRLYNGNFLFPNAEVSEIEIGYHSMLPFDSGRQVLVPTWKITVTDTRDNSRDHFVNASDQFVLPVSNEGFIKNVLDLSIENTKAIKDNDDFKQSMLDVLSSKLNYISE